MLRILNKIRKTGIITEDFPPVVRDDETEIIGKQVQAEIAHLFAGSLAIRQVDAGSCNGCELEIHALSNPYYSIERFGIHFVASPRHADALLVTGVVSRNMQAALLRTYEATPAPKLVIAVGACAVDGGEFGISYASCGAVNHVIPVDVMIAGCPPTPTALLTGILQAIRQKK
ncbi:NADH-quinone oxidoreductase subunit B family protein [Beggiatoa leptomitoformis]|uniref:NADH-quinone oxidoreductase subunit NuoB n=1 Tax=Beggiatoa leptomitoformis TaxID=288004 RepID=A0A2N9YDA9_9GAMM|nr:NADH-quinone oxidoreductase subunit B family protein [Beggiatoa leptomitoformis]ALG69144.1 NADH-quinone oxidoreductase subunit NuoB [Beggiatoa leptomitoformis]AUI68436.1 NADH-quinone oxidoreductase subunit NuoB [Beggiatoa leptomitoformis]